MSYAKGTETSVEKTQGEIRRTLQKYKATGFAFGEQLHQAMVMFELGGRRVKFVLPYVQPSDPKVKKARVGGYSDAPKSVQEKRLEQFRKERWRALGLAIKAKLEAVESGITTFEEEFLAHIVLPNGSTFGQVAIPQIERSYKDGTMPPLLGYSS